MSTWREYTIRKATAEDLPRVLAIRGKLFLEMEIPHETLVADSAGLLRERYEREFRQDALAHFIAYDAAGNAVACVGVLLKDDFPYHLFKPGAYGWIVDVYTEPAHRGRGLSRQLLELTLAWLRSKGISEAKLLASGSDAARLYERSGFRRTWEFYLPLDEGRTYNDHLNDREARRQGR
jgi:GNAT superfamily N-acetyltransferase